MATQGNTPAFAGATQNPNLTELTKREYFAVRMASAILSTGEKGTTEISARAVKYADALIDALNIPVTGDKQT
jgi:hypothetical protein